MSEEYNDKKIKEILMSEKIPQRLEPENIKAMLDESGAVQKRKKIKKSRALRFTSLAAAAALVIGSSAYFIKPVVYENEWFSTKCMDVAPVAAKMNSMKYAKKYGDIYNCFHAASSFNKFKDYIFGGNKTNGVYFDDMEVYEEAGGLVGEEADEEFTFSGEVSESMADYESAEIVNSDDGFNNDIPSQKNGEYSDTYNQEEGVLEADIVKTDGKNLFYSCGDVIYCTQTDKGKFVNPDSKSIPELLGENKTGDKCWIEDMYIYNGKLIVIGSINDLIDEMSDRIAPYNAKTFSAVLSYDNGLSLDGWYTQDGFYSDVRLMSDGFMYVISNDDKYINFDLTKEKDFEKYIPQYGVCGTNSCVPAEDILIPKEKLSEVYNYISYTNISGLNLNSAEPWNSVDLKSVAGYTNTLYCSQKNLYITSGYDETEITRFELNSGIINPVASGKVNGRIKDQFSMSEYNGYFRVAVTENVYNERFDRGAGEESSVASMSITRKNSIYILDMSMNIIGSITDLGLNEEIKSVNFNGNTAYIVTFRQTDPLYAVDLSVPTAPVLLDELKISGYSSYMQKWGEVLLLGFGAEADPSTGVREGIKLTMFDNSDPNNLKALDSVSIVQNDGDYIYSDALNERKALYIDPERNIIGFPLRKEINDRKNVYWGTYYEHQWESSYEFYSFENGKLVYRGSLLAYMDYGFERVVYIDGYIYAVSSYEFKSMDASTFTEVDTLKIN